MQPGLDFLHPDYTKERNKRERGHSFGVWHHSATKKMGIGCIAVAFSRHLCIAHAVLEYTAVSSEKRKSSPVKVCRCMVERFGMHGV